MSIYLYRHTFLNQFICSFTHIYVYVSYAGIMSIRDDYMYI